MSDNVSIRDYGNNSVPVASDEISGVQYQIVKVGFGQDGTVTHVSSIAPFPVSAMGALTYNDLQNPPPIGLTRDYAPGYKEDTEEPNQLSVDPDGNGHFRGSLLTDEGSYRTNFANSSLDISIGSATFTNGSTIVSGCSGLTTALKDMHRGAYVFLDADGAHHAEQIASYNDTTIILEEPYTGTGGTGESSRQILKSILGTGASFTVTNGSVTISAGTTSGVAFELERTVDILPLVKQTDFAVSQRIANQAIKVGFYDEVVSPPRFFAWFVIDGTTSTTVRCESSRNPTSAATGGEIQQTTATIPNGKTTLTNMRYRIELLFDRANFWIDGILVAQHFKSLPLPDDVLVSTIRIENNGTPATNTTLSVDYDSCRNFNALDISTGSDATAWQMAAAPGAVVSGSVSANNTDFFVFDCLQTKQIFVQISSVGGGGTVSWQGSNDSAFGATIAIGAIPAAGGAPVTTSTGVGHWVINPTTRYVRVRTTAYTSGTLIANAVLFQQQMNNPAMTTTVTGTITANIGSGSIAAGTNAIGDVGIQYRANATGAATIKHIISSAGPNPNLVKGSAGRVVGWSISNNTTSARYVKLINQATTPTSASTPVSTIMVPPNDVREMMSPGGIGFATGIGFTIVAGIADNDYTSVGANEVSVDIYYA
jgi:hypothetical protein